MEIDVKDWGKTPLGDDVKLFTLTNAQGNSVALTNYGATWVSAIVPDGKGSKGDVLLGFPSLKGYLADTCYIGSTVGRYANRIEMAQFVIDGQTYNVSANVAPHTLHGGVNGFNQRVWGYELTASGVTFTLTSADGDQGFPGNVQVRIGYEWSDTNELTIRFWAQTDKPTQVNLTNHAYFNLKGDGDIHEHELKIYSNDYLPMKSGSIVSGEFRAVQNTPFDFTVAKMIGRDIDDNDDQLLLARGFDHTFVLKRANDATLVKAAEAYEPVTGRAMEVYTTYPSVHLYAANFLSSTDNGKKGKPYSEREAFCLETQYMPNSANQPAFTDSTLRPGQTYDHTTVFRFFTRR